MKRSWGLALLALLFLLFPQAVHSHYYLGISIMVGVFALAALGLDLLFGYAGQLSLGQAAFMGIGAYTSAILTTRAQFSPVAAMVGGAVLAAGLAFLVGRAVLRLKGYYFVIATLACGLVFEQVMTGWIDVTGGPSGLTGIPAFGLGKLAFTSDTQYHYLVWSLVWLAMAGLGNVTSGRVGRVFRAVAVDDEAAGVLAIDVAAYKIRAFVLSAVLASVGGSVFAHYMRFISPEMVGMQTSLALATMVCLGGVGHLWGALLGVALLKVLPELIGWLRDYQLIVNGLILMVMMIGMPRGLAGALHMRFKRKEAICHGRVVADQQAQ